MKFKAFLLLLGLFLMPSLTSAETVLRIGESIAVDDNQTVNGDYYVSVGPLGNTTMSGAITEDMYALGGTVTVNGTIGHDLTIIGGSSQVHATVTDDVRVVGGEVIIAEHIGGDLFVIGGVLKMLSTASVAGDIIFFGGDADINGNVGGSVLGTSKKIRIDAEVKGDVDVKTATRLTLGSKANVGGFVRYASLEPLLRAPNASVAGEVSQNEYYTKSAASNTKTRNALIPLFITLFATLSLYLLFKKELQVFVHNVHNAPLKNGMLGLAVLVLGPVIALLLTVTVLGVLVGVMSLGVVLILYAVGYSLTGVVLGSYLSKMFTKHATVSLPWILTGTATMYVLMFIPLLGIAVACILFALAVGGLVTGTYKLLS